MTIDWQAIRNDFPILSREIKGKPLSYLDNAATTQKPESVIRAMDDYYRFHNANVHRSVHVLSEEATALYENARKKIKHFVNAASHKEIIFVRGATEAINLVAHSFLEPKLQKDDVILVSMMEHHSNIVPWQLVAEKTGAKVIPIPVLPSGDLDCAAYQNLFNEKVKMVALTAVSNALGTINPIKECIAMAHQHQVPILIDAAQAMLHLKMDVQDLDCDFLVFSGHKMLGPTGIGALYGKEKHLHAMPPYQGGGEMILSVGFDRTTFNDIPYRFEAGTPAIADAVGLGAAIDYIDALGLANIAAREQTLLQYATSELKKIPGLRIIGEAKQKVSVISFMLDDIHPHDLASLIDGEGVAIRAGHHCTMPLMKFYGIPATSRASLCFYNTEIEIDRLVHAILQAKRLFAV